MKRLFDLRFLYVYDSILNATSVKRIKIDLIISILNHYGMMLFQQKYL